MVTKPTQKSISSLGIRRGVSAKRYLPETTSVASSQTSSKKDIAEINKTAIRQRIEKKAYEIFEKRGYAHGNDLQDWIEAEQIVTKELRR